jgi:hypothetical protein
MDKRIIYKNPDNTVSIIVPSPNALKIMSIEDIAKKRCTYWIKI